MITRLKAESQKWDTLIVVEKDKLFAEMDEMITQQKVELAEIYNLIAEMNGTEFRN